MKKGLFIVLGLILASAEIAAAKERTCITKDGNTVWLEEQYSCNYEYDSEGNLVHKIFFSKSEQSPFSEEWFDKKGNVIHEKNIADLEIWDDYDSNGFLVHYKIERKIQDNHVMEYDYESEADYENESALEIYEKWYQNDEHGNDISWKDSDGREETKENEYDQKGRLIHARGSEIAEYWNEYDDRGNLICRKYKNGGTEAYEYDDRNNLIHAVECEIPGNKPYEKFYKYDDQNRMISYKADNGIFSEYEYDEKGNVIHYRNEENTDEYYSYEYNDKGQINRQITQVRIFYTGTEIRSTCCAEIRKSENANAKVLAEIPEYTRVLLLKVGKADVIDGINSPWLKVKFKSGEGSEIEGWCFGGYLEECPRYEY